MTAGKKRNKIRVLCIYFSINVISGIKTVPEERHAPKWCPIKLYNVLNLYIISYFARTTIDEAMDRDFYPYRKRFDSALSGPHIYRGFFSFSRHGHISVTGKKAVIRKLMIMFFVVFLFFFFKCM